MFISNVIWSDFVPRHDNTDEDFGHKMTTRRIYGPYRHGRRWRVQVREKGKQQRYRSFSDYSGAVDFMNAGNDDLRSVSDGLLRRAAATTSTRGGWVYAIATNPESARRLKVGFTNDLKRRFC